MTSDERAARCLSSGQSDLLISGYFFLKIQGVAFSADTAVSLDSVTVCVCAPCQCFREDVMHYSFSHFRSIVVK